MGGRKILYIGNAVPKSGRGGADVINARNIKLLKVIYGDNLYIYELKHRQDVRYKLIQKICKIYNRLRLNIDIIYESDYPRILKMIERYKIDDIFLSTSLLGKLSNYVKRKCPSVRIISFFHNVEAHYYDEFLKVENNLKNRIVAKIICQNEKYTIINSDIVITLNERDSNKLQTLYGRSSTFILPTTFDDKYDSHLAQKYVPLLNNKVHLLFVGVNFFANIHGIKWFIDNVLHQIPNAHLTIVGSGMDKVFKNTYQLTVHGFVDDLSHFYYNADIVVLPIFYGAGMKTKTAEALMYGCPIIGTLEAFEGYEFDPYDVGCQTNAGRDMINFILEFVDYDKLLQYRANARKIFLNKYQTTSYINKLKEIL